MGCEVDVIYLDFAKAFDKVDHNILLLKMKRLRIEDKILRWVEVFLKNREQRVKVGNALSSPVDVTSGVPQGSVLGPLLFIIMMTDIDEQINISKLTSFADDTRVTYGIRDPNDQMNFQLELNKIYNWATANNMVFNDKKFECLSLGTFGRTVRSTNYTSSSGLPIENKDTIKDLGILISSELQFKAHIEEVAAMGHRMSGFVLRTFTSREKTFMRTTLKSLIIPQIEYGCVVWAPCNQTQIDTLESVQRRFTSKISSYKQYSPTLDLYICVTTYKDRLIDLKLYSQQRRRERFLILQIYKMVIKYLPNCGFIIDSRRNGSTEPRRDGWHVEPKPIRNRQVPNWIVSAKENSFFVRAPRLYNSLPGALRQPEPIVQPTKAHVENFKASLDQYLGSIDDDPDRGSENSLLSDQIRYRTNPTNQ